MFDFFMYLLAGAFFVWAAVTALSIVLMPVYFWLRWRSD